MIKSADVDKGGGGKTLIHKMWINTCFFFEPFPNKAQDKYRTGDDSGGALDSGLEFGLLEPV